MRQATQPLVSMQALSKSYGSIQALRGLTLEVNTGSLFGLLGPNGSGKTSALECILGLRKPDSGTLRVAGVDVPAHPDRIRPLVGAVIQGTRLTAEITPREALGLFAHFHAGARPVTEVLRLFSLEALADQRFDTLSAGQQQRVMVALAVLGNPGLLVLDEPFTGLDAAARGQLHALLRQLHADGTTILLCTHDLQDAAELCDTVAIMHEGRTLAQGSPAELLSRHGIPHQLDFTARGQIDAEALQGLPAALSLAATRTGWRLCSREPQACVLGLIARLSTLGAELIDLHVTPPSLSELYRKLTGLDWENTSGKEGRQ